LAFIVPVAAVLLISGLVIPSVRACGNPCGSPIIIDTIGEGFRLTSAQDGVLFDLSGTGGPVQIGWTQRGSHNALLALDRNRDRRITSGRELFGNFTSQPFSDNPNGYLALAEFDKPANGGNGDGLIDQRDAVFKRLLLWIDENHDGISQPNEVHDLPELGVYSISLRYTETRRQDRFGNWFRYRGIINPEGRTEGDHVDRVIYDVFFTHLDANGIPFACCTTCGP